MLRSVTTTPPSRRTVLRTTAWAVPAVAATVAAPAFAASTAPPAALSMTITVGPGLSQGYNFLTLYALKTDGSGVQVVANIERFVSRPGPGYWQTLSSQVITGGSQGIGRTSVFNLDANDGLWTKYRVTTVYEDVRYYSNEADNVS